jgi:hypothetical protein
MYVHVTHRMENLRLPNLRELLLHNNAIMKIEGTPTVVQLSRNRKPLRPPALVTTIGTLRIIYLF